MSSDLAVEKRIYVGGLTEAVTEDDVLGRFKPFGEVSSVEVLKTADGKGCRGFGYVSISIKPSQWRRCVSVYTGSRWKGGKLKIEEAKEDYMTKLKREWASANTESADGADESEQDSSSSNDKNKAKKRRCNTKSDGWMADDMSLVTAKNVGKYKGWSKGRYGRPVLRVTMAKLDGSSFTYDPAKYKNNFEKLFGSVRPKNWDQLEWEYNEELGAQDVDQARALPDRVLEYKERMAERFARQERLAAEAKRAQENMISRSKLAKEMKPSSKKPTYQESTNSEAEAEEERGDISYTDDDSSDDDVEMAAADLSSSKIGNSGELRSVSFDDIVDNAGESEFAPNAELKEKLVSGVFDSDSEDDGESAKALALAPASALAPAKISSSWTTSTAASSSSSKPMTHEEIELAKERQRTSNILSQLLSSVAAPAPSKEKATQDAAVDSSDESDYAEMKAKASKPANVADFTDDFEAAPKQEEHGADDDESALGPQDGSGHRSSKKSSKEADPNSSGSGSSDDSDGSGGGGSDEDGSSSGSGYNSNNSGGNDSNDASGSEDSDSGSDDNSSDDDDSDSDADSDAEEKGESAEAMDVDPKPKKGLSGLFGGSSSDQQSSASGGGLFGAAGGGFKFTAALGLEEDMPSAMAHEAESEAPVTGGGSGISGPAERNLNANRLPLFFADVDSPMFAKPEPVFQRQKTEEELEKELAERRSELTKEYKAQHRAVVKKAQKLSQRKPKGPSAN